MRKYPKSLIHSPKFLGLDLIDLVVLSIAIILPQIFLISNIFISLGVFLIIKLGRYFIDVVAHLKGFEIQFKEFIPYVEDL